MTNFESVLRYCLAYDHYKKELANQQARSLETWRDIKERTYFLEEQELTAEHLKYLQRKIESYLKDEVA